MGNCCCTQPPCLKVEAEEIKVEAEQSIPSFTENQTKILALQHPDDIPVNPFPTWNVVGFNQEDIFKDLSCQICFDIAVMPKECSYCHKLFCQLCVKDENKKNKITKCPICKQSPWNLQQIHILYANMLCRLQFKCNAPFCKGIYKIDDYTNHTHIIEPSKSISVEYYMKDTEGVVTAFDSYLCEIIEKYRQDNQAAIFTQFYGIDSFGFDLFSNTVTRQKDNKKYSLIKRNLLIPKQHDQFRWIWKDDGDNNWKAYTLEVSNHIENSYLKYVQNPQNNCKYSFNLNKVQYTVNFKTWKQINGFSKFERDVFRCKEVEKKRFG